MYPDGRSSQCHYWVNRMHTGNVSWRSLQPVLLLSQLPWRSRRSVITELVETDRDLIINAQSSARVITGRDTSHQITSKSLTHCSLHMLLYIGRELGTNEVEWTGKAEIRKTEFMAASETCKAIFWPTPGWKDSNFGGCRLRVTLISTSVVPHRRAIGRLFGVGRNFGDSRVLPQGEFNSCVHGNPPRGNW